MVRCVKTSNKHKNYWSTFKQGSNNKNSCFLFLFLFCKAKRDFIFFEIKKVLFYIFILHFSWILNIFLQKNICPQFPFNSLVLVENQIAK